MDHIMDKKMIDGDEIETTLRPQSLKEYIGQRIKRNDENIY